MISAFVAPYGCVAVFLGTLLEGETVLIAAGFAAHRGMLDWPLVVLAATVGGVLGDQSAFLLVRWKSDARFDRFPQLARRKARIHDLLERYDVVAILAVRFRYGLRVAGPIFMGSSRIPLRRFAVFNLIGAALWAVLVSGAGYAFGLTISSMIADVRRIEELLLLVILALGVVFRVWRGIRAKNRQRTMKA